MRGREKKGGKRKETCHQNLSWFFTKIVIHLRLPPRWTGGPKSYSRLRFLLGICHSSSFNKDFLLTSFTRQYDCLYSKSKKKKKRKEIHTSTIYNKKKVGKSASTFFFSFKFKVKRKIQEYTFTPEYPYTVYCTKRWYLKSL